MCPARLPTDDDPIVALATPVGESALALIRTAGTGSIALAARLFRGERELLETPDKTLTHGRIVDPRSGETVDEVVAWVRRAPGGYTGQDAVEVSCHGGHAVVTRLLDLFLRGGFREALPGEFTLRAFRSGRMDLTRAEAVNELVRARSERARALAVSRLAGSVYASVEAITRDLEGLQARLELSLDYPEDEVDTPPPGPEEIRAVRDAVESLCSTYRVGRLIQEGARVVIAGRANAGKSTLFNHLLREDRAIVSPTPGTTRDYLEAPVSLEGYALRLFDTAGLGAGRDEIEREGVARSRSALEHADLVLYLVDGMAGETAEDRENLAAMDPRRVIRVWSKADTAPRAGSGYLGCSGLTGSGVEDLRRAVVDRLYAGVGSGEEGAVIDSERQKRHLEEAGEALRRAAAARERGLALDLVAVDLREALDAMGAITGRVTTEEILNTMFSRFCVGK